jgi:hypothetical protein
MAERRVPTPWLADGTAWGLHVPPVSVVPPVPVAVELRAYATAAVIGKHLILQKRAAELPNRKNADQTRKNRLASSTINFTRAAGDSGFPDSAVISPRSWSAPH